MLIIRNTSLLLIIIHRKMINSIIIPPHYSFSSNLVLLRKTSNSSVSLPTTNQVTRHSSQIRQHNTPRRSALITIGDAGGVTAQ